MENTEWVVGAYVAEHRTGWGRESYGPPRKIAKIYANGNFIIEGDEFRQQWRPYKTHASKTNAGYSSNSVVLWNKETIERANTANKAARAAKALAELAESLGKLSRSRDDEEVIKKAEEMGLI